MVTAAQKALVNQDHVDLYKAGEEEIDRLLGQETAITDQGVKDWLHAELGDSGALLLIFSFPLFLGCMPSACQCPPDL